MASCLRPTLLLLALICAAWPFPVSATLAPKAAPMYAEGLDGLADGRWPEAVSAFSRALEQAGDDPEIVLARGVAETLAEEFPRALKDLERAKRLGYRGREPELWTYVAEAMSGIIVVPHHALGGGPRGVPSDRPAVVSIPGHIAQGHDDYSTEYGAFIVYRLGMEYQKHRLPADYGGSGHPEGTKSPQMRQAMREAGRLFAERQYRRPELSSINVARAKKSDGTGGMPGTIAHIERALAANPADPEAHLQAAKALLEAGRPAGARKEFTIALTLKSDLAEAYLGRATAAARLGDESRMEADLAVYKKGGWFATRSSRSVVEDELRDHKAKGSREALLRDLQEQAQGGKPLEVLIETASRLHRVAGKQRRRYDELYQDRIRLLEDAVRDNPKNPDRLVDLASYLVSEADNRGEKVEPRRELQPYRFQISREQELQRAIQLADRALALSGKHVGAMMQKAVALTALKRYDQADTLADQALDLAGNNADALRLYAKFRAMRANQMSSEAWSLRQERCSSSSHEETRSDGVYRVTSTTCYPPSQADLQRASQLESTAAELRRRARAALEKAAAVTKGTVDGDLILADLALWDGRTAEAQSHLEQAVKRDPTSLDAQDRLVQHYAQTGQTEKAEEQRVVAANLVQTTAAPLLRLAWNRIEKTAWQGAKAYLARADAIDPIDARIPAFLGVVREGDGKPNDATAHYRAALALEEARLQLDDPPAPKGADPGRDAMEFGLAIQARLHLARLAASAGNQTDALAHYQAILGYERRMGRGFESRQMFTALWPDQQPVKGAVVVAPKNAATLIAEAHLQSGKLLAAMGKREEAIEHLRSAAMAGQLKMAGMPKIGNAKGDTNYSGLAGVPAQEAQILLAKELIAKGDVEGARAMLYEAGNGVPDHLRKEINAINQAITRLPTTPAPDPYADTKEEQEYLEQLRQQQGAQARRQMERNAERQAQRERDLARRTLMRLPPLATLVPSLVGRWEMAPDNPSASKRTLTIGRDSGYSLVTNADGATIRGTAYLQGNPRGRRNREEPSRGQIMLYDEATGQIGSMSYELSDDGTVLLTGASGTKYTARRMH